MPALEAHRPESFTPLEREVWGLYQRLAPFRSVGGMGEVGPIPWGAMNDLLDREGYRGRMRKTVEALLARTDVAARNAVAEYAASRSRRAH